MSQGGKFEIFEEHGSAHLEIYDSDVSDSGVYKCTATNSTGSVTSSCIVTVKGMISYVNYSKHNTGIVINLLLMPL